MFDNILLSYQSFIFFYAVTLTITYVSLAFFGYYNIAKSKLKYTDREEELLNSQPSRIPGISVIAPAYNEEVLIVNNATSFLNLDYPKFEVVIVNDGSTDRTLELLIENFDLKEVSFPYIEKIYCSQFKRLFKSTNPKFKHLTVVDKLNAGTKADAMNAGINVAQYDYVINTDMDCILSPDTLKKVIIPVLDSTIPVIAVGATMRMVNGCNVEDGTITRVSPPKEFVTVFQETEYLRSYLVSKMGWSVFNAMPNVSGGFGLFDKSVLIEAGGFDPHSHAEDMDITLRIAAFMRSQKRKYRIIQIPDTCCWTEGPTNLKVFHRQRSRWGRGLIQIFVKHRRLLFNNKYGKIGLTVTPYALLFEFLAPIIEVLGIGLIIYLLFTNQINFNTFWLMLGFVFMTGITISLLTITLDMWVKKIYEKNSEYIKLLLYTPLEAFFYHPFIVAFTLHGYWQYLTSRDCKWGIMTRKGFAKKEVIPT